MASMKLNAAKCCSVSFECVNRQMFSNILKSSMITYQCRDHNLKRKESEGPFYSESLDVEDFSHKYPQIHENCINSFC